MCIEMLNVIARALRNVRQLPPALAQHTVQLLGVMDASGRNARVREDVLSFALQRSSAPVGQLLERLAQHAKQQEAELLRLGQFFLGIYVSGRRYVPALFM